MLSKEAPELEMENWLSSYTDFTQEMLEELPAAKQKMLSEIFESKPDKAMLKHLAQEFAGALRSAPRSQYKLQDQTHLHVGDGRLVLAPEGSYKIEGDQTAWQMGPPDVSDQVTFYAHAPVKKLYELERTINPDSTSTTFENLHTILDQQRVIANIQPRQWDRVGELKVLPILEYVHDNGHPHTYVWHEVQLQLDWQIEREVTSYEPEALYRVLCGSSDPVTKAQHTARILDDTIDAYAQILPALKSLN